MNQQDYNIRLAQQKECPALPIIEHEANKRFHEFGLMEVNIDRVSSIADLYLAQRNNCLWVAEFKTRNILVGFAYVRLISGQPHLEEIDVLPKYGRQGLGTALVKAALNWSKINNFKQLTLSTFNSIPWNMPFYQRLGFMLVADSDLTPEFLELKEKERSLGLPMRQRVIMVYSFI